jgi:mannose-6-phosphate isomerase-like protein (cupin superfamily)
MIATGSTYSNPKTGGTMTIVKHWDDTNDELLELERMLPPKTGKNLRHRHPDWLELFTVVEGHVTATLEGEALALGPGETMTVDRGIVHTDPSNPGPDRAVIRLRIEPVTRFAKAFAETHAACAADNRLNRQDELPFLQMAVVSADLHAAGAPHAWQDRMIPLFAVVGRLRGYRTVEPPSSPPGHDD